MLIEGSVHFDLQPTLTGQLVELRPLRESDYDAVFRAASDPLIWEQHPESDRYTPEKFQRYFRSAMESGGAFAVLDRRSGRVIGCTRYCNLDPAAGEIEIGWTFLERAFWGGPCNGEMKALLLAHALRFVERVVFVVGEHNLRSQKALAKIGATELRRAQRLRPDGTLQNDIVFAVSRPRQV